jgi:hypothetical protein
MLGFCAFAAGVFAIAKTNIWEIATFGAWA